MKTIRKVFGANLKRLRGDRTQVEMAELLELELSTYQRLEAGQIPQKKTIKKITSKLEVSEVELYQDPEWRPRKDPVRALKIISDALGMSSTVRRRILELVDSLDDSELESLLAGLESDRAAVMEDAETPHESEKPSRQHKKPR